jgi:hypothetical protein
MSRRAIGIGIVVVILLAIALDIYLAVDGENGNTISAVTLTAVHKVWGLAFTLVGYVLGYPELGPVIVGAMGIPVGVFLWPNYGKSGE